MAGCEDIHAVGQEPQYFLLNFGIHDGERILLQWTNQESHYLARRLFSRDVVGPAFNSEIAAETRELGESYQADRVDFPGVPVFRAGYWARIFLISSAWL
jgi:hypothetical protein